MIRLLSLLLPMLLLPVSASGLSFTHELTEAQIQQRVDMAMPLRRKTLLADVVVRHPKVELKEGSDRISIHSDIQATLANGQVINGTGLIEGRIHYVPESGQFYFADPQLIDLTIANTAAQDKALIQGIADVIIKKALAMFPVYELDDKDLRQKMAKAMLKSVTVRDRKLILELAP